jgi:hypothetical protein
MRRLVVLFAFAVALPAQTTWKGLRFGMSDIEAQKQYKGTLQKEAPRKDAEAGSAWITLTDRNQKLLQMPARVSLEFDKTTKALAQIDIIVENAVGSEVDPTGAPTAIIDGLNNHVREKYGAPIILEGDCGLTVEILVRARMPQCINADKCGGRKGRILKCIGISTKDTSRWYI